MSRHLAIATLTAACMLALTHPGTAGSCRTAPADAACSPGARSLDRLDDQLRELGEQAQQAGEDAVAAGRAALDAALAKLRERAQARRHGKGAPPSNAPGGEIANI